MRSVIITITIFANLIFFIQKSRAQWSPVGGGTTAEVVTLYTYENKLYAAGYYYHPLPYPHSTPFIESWHNESWHSESNSLNDNITALYCLKTYKNSLYVGGGDGVDMWNGASWETSGAMRARVMEVYDSLLYVGGYDIWHFDGTSWKMTDTVDFPGISEFAVYHGSLYVWGYFNSINGVPLNHLAKWDGSTWSAVGSGLPKPDYSAMAVFNNELYFGGKFLKSEGYPSDYIMKWNDSTWLPVGSGANGPISALDSAHYQLFASGDFTMIDSVPANKIAEYDGQWHAMGTGLGPSYAYTNCIFPYLDKIYVGGYHLESAGGINVDNIARWGHYVGLANVSKNSMLSIYPNPASSFLNIAYSITTGSILLVVDSYGLTVKKFHLDPGTHIIQTGDFASGIYMVTLLTESDKVSKKIIIIK